MLWTRTDIFLYSFCPPRIWVPQSPVHCIAKIGSAELLPQCQDLPAYAITRDVLAKAACTPLQPTWLSSPMVAPHLRLAGRRWKERNTALSSALNISSTNGVTGAPMHDPYLYFSHLPPPSKQLAYAFREAGMTYSFTPFGHPDSASPGCTSTLGCRNRLC